jgi:Glycosyl transferase family 2
MTPGNEVTICLTACGRPDLLEKTLNSFFEFNTYPFDDFFIYEDSGNVAINEHLWKMFPQIKWLGNIVRKGQIIAIDTLYKQVKTEYIFHLEDDWEFYKSGFIEESLKILENDPAVCMVWLRDRADTNQHPIIWQDSFGMMKTNHNGLWGGFCFNPGLRRKSDYDRFGSYNQHTQFQRSKPWKAEAMISKLYSSAGFRAAILKDGYIKHIGQNRHVH